jgi:hypothetical protein
MHINRLIRGGLVVTGVGISTIFFATSAGAGSRGVVAAPVADVASVVVVTSEDASEVVALPVAPAAVPVLIEVPVTAIVAEPAPTVEAEPEPEPVPEIPVVQAGPGPATPVEGAITLIDPLVIERDPAEIGA